MLTEMGKKAKLASLNLAQCSEELKNKAKRGRFYFKEYGLYY